MHTIARREFLDRGAKMCFNTMYKIRGIFIYLMKLPKNKLFFQKEFFGSRIYNAESQEEYFLNEKSTYVVEKIISSDDKNKVNLSKFKGGLAKEELLTSDIIPIKNKRSYGLSSPQRISLNITRKCNLRCKHCFTSAGNADEDELTTEELFKLIDQMKEAGSFFLAIGGGEPLLRDDLFRVIKYARENFIAVSLVTNGLLVNEKIAQKLDALNLNTITVSLDGLEKNHDFIRGKDNFIKTINNVKILRKYCRTAKLAARVTVSRLNINECGELIKIAEDLSLDLIRLTPMLLLGRAKDNQQLLMNQDEYIRFLGSMRNINSKIKLVLPNQGDSDKWFVCPEDFGCHCGKETCWITQTGDFYPCIFFGDRFLAGNIRNEKFLDLWDKFKNMVKLEGNETCKNCADYKKCRGGCRARALVEYGDINAVDPFCVLRKNKTNILNQ